MRHLVLVAGVVGPLPLLGAVAVVLLTACAERPAGSATSTELLAPSMRDSAGVEIVDVPGELLEGLPVWRFSDEPLLSIGAVEGEAPYLFSRLSAARLLDSGEIVVADGQSRELRVFGADGRFERKYGRPGEGPGEFVGYPLNVSETDGRRVSVFDYPLSRVTTLDLLTGVFTTKTTLLDCREAPDPEPRPCAEGGERPLADGTLFASHSELSPAPPGDGLAVRRGAPRRYGILNNDGFQVVDSVASPTGVRSGFGADFFSAIALFEPGGQVAFGSAAIVLGDPHRFELRVRDANGSLRRIIRVLVEPVTVTTALLDGHRRWADTARTHPVAREYLASIQPGGTVPFFGGLALDRAGRIWVRDYRPPRWWGAASPDAWTILDPAGVPSARIEADAPGAIIEAGADYVLTRETDDLGVEYVRMYRLEEDRF